MRIVVAVYRDGARVHCSTLGAKPHWVLETISETPEFFENVAAWLVYTFESSSFPIKDGMCEARLVRVEDEQLEYEFTFRHKRATPKGVILSEAQTIEAMRLTVKRDEYGNVDFRVPPPQTPSDKD